MSKEYLYNECPDEELSIEPPNVMEIAKGVGSITGSIGIGGITALVAGPFAGILVGGGCLKYLLDNATEEGDKKIVKLCHYSEKDQIKYWFKKETDRQKQLRKLINKNYNESTLIFGWAPYIINPKKYFTWPRRVPKEKNINVCRLRHAEKMLQLTQTHFEPEQWGVPKIKKERVNIYYDGYDESQYNSGRFVRSEEVPVDMTLSNNEKVKFESSQFQDKHLLKEYWEIEVTKLKKILKS